MGQSLFKKHSKFQNSDEIFYCGMTRPRNTYLNVLIQCHHTRTILRKKNTGQSLFKKYSKFQKLDKLNIEYCGITKFRRAKLGVFRQYQNTNKTILKNFQNFKNFNKVVLLWLGQMREKSIAYGLIRLTQRITEKKIELHNFSEILCHGYI